MKNYFILVFSIILSNKYLCQNIEGLKKNQNSNKIFLVAGNYIFIDTLSDTNTFNGNLYLEKEFGNYSLCSELNSQLLKQRIKDFKSEQLYVYDSLFNVSRVPIVKYRYLKIITPHFSIIQEWEEQQKSESDICNDLIKYSYPGYLTTPITKPSFFLIASENKLPFISAKKKSTEMHYEVILNWIAKQKSVLKYQTLYLKNREKKWWNDNSTTINTSLFELDSNKVFGITNVVYDGNEMSDVSPYGISITYIYSIINKEIINGVESDKTWGNPIILSAFINKSNLTPYIILKDILSGSIFLMYEINNKWNLNNSIEMGYFDCPY